MWLFLAVLLLAASSGGGRASGVEDRSVATVYVTNWTSNSISRFQLTAGGALELREVVPGPAGSANALGAVLSRDKRSLLCRAVGIRVAFPLPSQAQWWSGGSGQYFRSAAQPNRQCSSGYLT